MIGYIKEKVSNFLNLVFGLLGVVAILWGMDKALEYGDSFFKKPEVFTAFFFKGAATFILARYLIKGIDYRNRQTDHNILTRIAVVAPLAFVVFLTDFVWWRSGLK